MSGHLSAAVSVLIWGTTFISTKILLEDFVPIEILFFRFVLGYAALWIVSPKFIKPLGFKKEILFAGAGLCGVTLYFLFENIALTYSPASNIGVIVSVAPFFTAICAYFFLKKEKLSPSFFAGFLLAIIGITLISFNGKFTLELNPLGDLLGVFAAVAWAFYSILTKKISAFEVPLILMTRRIFFYGLLFIMPVLFFFDFRFGFERFSNPTNLFNILFLGFGASALCFAVWNRAVRILGAVKTSVYIYMTPVVTVITSAIVLKEKITPILLVGVVFTLSGLILSEKKGKKDKG